MCHTAQQTCAHQEGWKLDDGVAGQLAAKWLIEVYTPVLWRIRLQAAKRPPVSGEAFRGRADSWQRAWLTRQMELDNCQVDRTQICTIFSIELFW